MADATTADTLARTIWTDPGSFTVPWALFATAVGGALGGLANYFSTDQAPVAGAPPDRWRALKSALIGLVAAIAALYAVEPVSDVKLIALAVVGGYAGKALLASLGARLSLAASREEVKAVTAAKEAATNAAAAAKAVKEAALDLAERALRGVPPSGGRGGEVGIAEAPPLDVAALREELRRLRQS